MKSINIWHCLVGVCNYTKDVFFKAPDCLSTALKLVLRNMTILKNNYVHLNAWYYMYKKQTEFWHTE